MPASPPRRHADASHGGARRQPQNDAAALAEATSALHARTPRRAAPGRNVRLRADPEPATG